MVVLITDFAQYSSYITSSREHSQVSDSKPVELNLSFFIRQLNERRSAKRRSAAKHLRKMADPKACSPLLAALKDELRDQRTWET